MGGDNLKRHAASSTKITEYTTPSDLYGKGADKRRSEKRLNGSGGTAAFNQETNLNKVLSQHTVQPDPDLLHRVAPDKKLMMNNSKGSPQPAGKAGEHKRTSSKVNKSSVVAAA